MDEHARDLRLRRTYGITLDEYKAMLAFQGECCGICKRPQETFKNSLSVDHWHNHTKVHIESRKGIGVIKESRWVARAEYCGQTIELGGPTKSAAIRSVRKYLKRMSVRGLLCHFCNRGLRYYADDPVRLANAAEYLRRHQGVV